MHLKGLALFAHHPEYQEIITNLPRFPRSVRLTIPGGTHSITQSLATALAHSVNASLLILDYKRLAGVRRACFESGVPKEFLSIEIMVEGLLQVVRQEEGGPYVVYLADKGRTVLQSKSACEALQHEIENGKSKLFTILSTEHDPESIEDQGVGSGQTGKDEGAGQSPAAPPQLQRSSSLSNMLPPAFFPHPAPLPSPNTNQPGAGGEGNPSERTGMPFPPHMNPNVPRMNIFIHPANLPFNTSRAGPMPGQGGVPPGLVKKVT